MTQLPRHVEYIPGYIQSFVNWAGYPPPRKRIACVMLEKALNAQLLRDMPPVLSGYNSGRDTYHWSKMVLPTRPLPESIGYNILAPRAVWNDDLARLQDTDRCCYFSVRYGEIYFQYVCQVMETTTNVAPIFPRARTEDEWPDDTTEDEAIAIHIRDNVVVHRRQTLATIRDMRSPHAAKGYEFCLLVRTDIHDLHVLFPMVLQCTTKLHDRLAEFREVHQAVAAGRAEQHDNPLAFAMFQRNHDRVVQIVRITGVPLPQHPTLRNLEDTLLRGLVDIRIPL